MSPAGRNSSTLLGVPPKWSTASIGWLGRVWLWGEGVGVEGGVGGRRGREREGLQA